MYTISNNIREIRRIRGLTQSQLANMIGVTKNTISSYECNIYQPSILHLICLADVLEVDAYSLINVRTSGGTLIQNWYI